MITTQILVKNNEKTIEKTLASIASLNSKILIGNLGSTDKTIEICSDFKTEIIDINNIKDYSKIRNSLAQEGLNFYINPWEILVQGHEKIAELGEATNVYVFENNVISKEIRFWNSTDLFKNPVYETIINKNAKISDQIIISSKNKPKDVNEKIILVKNWMNERPLDLEPCYYFAICHLSLSDYKNFLFYANKYCNMENKINNSLIMMKYYMSQVNLYLGNIKESAELVITCLSYFPAFAEFWCLLGDIYYFQKKWDKSKCFYENAKIIGQKRKNKDDMPIEITKYKEYPEKMINNIDKIKNNIVIMG